MAHINLTAQASRLSSNILQRSFFFFARMSCSEQSAFHGQASDRAWFFSELLFQSVAAEKKKRKKDVKLGGVEPRKEVRTLKDIERFYHTQIEEMPMDIADLL